MSSKKSIGLGILSGFLFLAADAHSALSYEYDVIINPTSKVESVTKDELKQIFLANKTTWSSGGSIQLVVLSPGNNDADQIAKELMDMTSWQAKNHYLKKAFSGAIPGQPENGDTPLEVVQLVAKLPGAISVVPKGTKTDKVKIIQVK